MELLVGGLFAELAQLSDYGAHGPNNIVLDGTLQHGAFRFASSTSHRFTIASQVVEFVTIDRAQFVTLPAQSTEHHVAARFLLEGSMGSSAWPTSTCSATAAPAGRATAAGSRSRTCS